LWVVPNQQRRRMKAIVLHEYGAPEELKFEDAPRPEPKDDQVLIRVIAAGVNPVDAHLRTGKSGNSFEPLCR
jgi:NADPH:quinone reductase-like Zn-dependent oxidoreductase